MQVLRWSAACQAVSRASTSWPAASLLNRGAQCRSGTSRGRCSSQFTRYTLFFQVSFCTPSGVTPALGSCSTSYIRSLPFAAVATHLGICSAPCTWWAPWSRTVCEAHAHRVGHAQWLPRRGAGQGTRGCSSLVGLAWGSATGSREGFVLVLAFSGIIWAIPGAILGVRGCGTLHEGLPTASLGLHLPGPGGKCSPALPSGVTTDPGRSVESHCHYLSATQHLPLPSSSSIFPLHQYFGS